MLPKIRQIRLIGKTKDRVTYQHVHDGKICNLPHLTFQLMLAAGAFDIVNPAF